MEVRSPRSSLALLVMRLRRPWLYETSEQVSCGDSLNLPLSPHGLPLCYPAGLLGPEQGLTRGRPSV